MSSQATRCARKKESYLVMGVGVGGLRYHKIHMARIKEQALYGRGRRRRNLAPTHPAYLRTTSRRVL